MTVRRSVLPALLLTGLVLLGPAPALAQGSPLFAVLLGGNEVTGTTANTGDQNGYGAATIILRPGLTPNLCWTLVVSHLATPTGAHIHQGNAGQNGAIVVTLAVPEDDAGNPAGHPGASAGCTTVSSTLLSNLRLNPSRYYVNVHTLGFSGGAIRGQLY